MKVQITFTKEEIIEMLKDRARQIINAVHDKNVKVDISSYSTVFDVVVDLETKEVEDEGDIEDEKDLF